MRNYGTCFELLRTRPHDHIGWVFTGFEQFAAIAGPFLAEGVAQGERLMYVAEDPDPATLGHLTDLVDRDTLQIASIADVYGASGIVDPPSQRATFAEALGQALAEGYSGIRVAADNTSLVLDEERLEAWIRWEIVADRFMSQNRVIGLCAFNRERVDVDRLRHLATLHPLFSATSFTPQFRFFTEDTSLIMVGEVDSSAVDQLWVVLANLPPKTDVVIDLAKATFMSHRVLSGLGLLSDTGVDVTIRGESGAIRDLREIVGHREHFFLVEN